MDRRPYEYQAILLQSQIDAAEARVVACESGVKVQQAEIVAANHDVLMLRADTEGTSAKVAQANIARQTVIIVGSQLKPQRGGIFPTQLHN